MAIKNNGKKIEKLIVDMAKKGLTSEKIGLALKKEHNLHTKKLEIKISEILKKHNLYTDADIKNITGKIEKRKKHLEKNKHDYKTKLALLKEEAKLRKLKKYKSRKTKKS